MLCDKISGLLSIIGWALLLFKVAIPSIIIIYGMLDLGKAVMSGKDEDIKKNAKTLGVRFIAGIIVFIVPSLVVWLFGLFVKGIDGSYGAAQDQVGFTKCENCLNTPWNCTSLQG